MRSLRNLHRSYKSLGFLVEIIVFRLWKGGFLATGRAREAPPRVQGDPRVPTAMIQTCAEMAKEQDLISLSSATSISTRFSTIERPDHDHHRITVLLPNGKLGRADPRPTPQFVPVFDPQAKYLDEADARLAADQAGHEMFVRDDNQLAQWNHPLCSLADLDAAAAAEAKSQVSHREDQLQTITDQMTTPY